MARRDPAPTARRIRPSGARRRTTRLALPLLALLVMVPRAAGQAPIDPAVEQEGRRALQVGIDRYLELRRQLDPVAPPLHRSIPAAQISKHRQDLALAVAKARSGARRGHILNSAVEKYIRHVVRAEYPDPRQLRDLLMEDDEAVPVPRLRVNAPIPGAVGVPIMPPRLLARFLELPEELEYRFVGRHFVLRDTETELVVDYIYDVVR